MAICLKTRVAERKDNTMRIGVPRGLLYYKYFPLWEQFLKSLGAEVVDSGITTKDILRVGAEKAENESCLPVKVFYGHVDSIVDKVDALFVPRVVSLKKRTHTCPKLLGLPDLARLQARGKCEVIGPTIDFHKGFWSNYRAVYDIGKRFTRNPVRIISAGGKAWKKHLSYRKRLKMGFAPDAAMGKGYEEKLFDGGRMRIAVFGHHYNIFDSFITMSLLERLRKMDIDIVTTDMIPEKLSRKELKRLPKSIYWSYESELAGSLIACARNHMADGIIFIVSFPCGPDSLVHVLCDQERRDAGDMPMLTLIIDEHTGEAGLMTRVEAFVDMLKRKHNKDAAERIDKTSDAISAECILGAGS